MRGNTVDKKGLKTQDDPWVRASISFPEDIYQSLRGIAQLKKVSLAWVVRDAAERYVASEVKQGKEGTR